MRHVQINNGVFVRHIPSEVESLRWDAKTKCSVRKLTPEQKISFGVERLQMVTPPSFDSATQVRTEGDAAVVGGVWAQQWIVTDLVDDDLAEAQAAQAERERIAGLEDAVNADTTVGALKAMTNAEFNAWFDANVTTAAQAIAILKRLTRVIIRRVL